MRETSMKNSSKDTAITSTPGNIAHLSIWAVNFCMRSQRNANMVSPVRDICANSNTSYQTKDLVLIDVFAYSILSK